MYVVCWTEFRKGKFRARQKQFPSYADAFGYLNTLKWPKNPYRIAVRSF